MNDLFSTITGLSMNAYEIAAVLCIISIPARIIFRALHGKAPI